MPNIELIAFIDSEVMIMKKIYSKIVIKLCVLIMFIAGCMNVENISTGEDIENLPFILTITEQEWSHHFQGAGMDSPDSNITTKEIMVGDEVILTAFENLSGIISIKQLHDDYAVINFVSSGITVLSGGYVSHEIVNIKLNEEVIFETLTESSGVTWILVFSKM